MHFSNTNHILHSGLVHFDSTPFLEVAFKVVVVDFWVDVVVCAASCCYCDLITLSAKIEFKRSDMCS
jgi:hypothetical protein